MNSGQYYHRPQNHGLPLGYYPESPESSTQSHHRILTFDGVPRTQRNEQSMTSPSLSPNGISNNYNIATSVMMPQSSQSWNNLAQSLSPFDDQSSNDDVYYGSYITGNEPDGFFGRPLSFADVPRGFINYNPRLLDENNLAPEAYEPSVYMIEPSRQNTQAASTNRATLPFNTMDSSPDFSRLSISRSPKMENDSIAADGTIFDRMTPPFMMPSGRTSEDGGSSSREMTAVEVGDAGTDEPYAKLIYRALMSVPNHTMVLQEIYQWFRSNTFKASSGTKGWMNSIRHNLSMNAAFRKTERRFSGDETKKSTEWVLEEFAIKDGVQSTTRYRKGAASKKVLKPETPAPSRQISGRKGGISSSKIKTQRQRATEDRSDSRRCVPRIDTGRRPLFPHISRSHLNGHGRQRSPLTPPRPESIASSTSYYFPKAEPYVLPYEDMCGLEDVQGVYIDDGPVFRDNQEGHFMSPRE